MTTNAIAVSRDLAAAGVSENVADAIAEAIVSHADETHATKVDIARLEGKIDTLAMQIKILAGMVVGLYVAMAALIVTNFIA